MALFKLTYKKFLMMKNMNDYSKRAKTMYWGKQIFSHNREEREHNQQIISKNELLIIYTLLLREGLFSGVFHNRFDKMKSFNMSIF